MSARLPFVNTEPSIFVDSDFGLPPARRSEAVYEPPEETPRERSWRYAEYAIGLLGVVFFVLWGLGVLGGPVK